VENPIPNCGASLYTFQTDIYVRNCWLSGHHVPSFARVVFLASNFLCVPTVHGLRVAPRPSLGTIRCLSASAPSLCARLARLSIRFTGDRFVRVLLLKNRANNNFQKRFTARGERSRRRDSIYPTSDLSERPGSQKTRRNSHCPLPPSMTILSLLTSFPIL
jgi:hypothetical protein